MVMQCTEWLHALNWPYCIQPFSGGTAVPRVRERLPSGFEISRSASKASKVSEPQAENVQQHYLYSRKTVLEKASHSVSFCM